MIFALESQRSPTVNAIERWLIFPLLNIFLLRHTNSVLSAVDSIKKLLFHLFLATNGFDLKSI